jgi:hypothetical protein
MGFAFKVIQHKYDSLGKMDFSEILGEVSFPVMPVEKNGFMMYDEMYIIHRIVLITETVNEKPTPSTKTGLLIASKSSNRQNFS